MLHVNYSKNSNVHVSTCNGVNVMRYHPVLPVQHTGPGSAALVNKDSLLQNCDFQKFRMKLSQWCCCCCYSPRLQTNQQRGLVSRKPHPESHNYSIYGRCPIRYQRYLKVIFFFQFETLLITAKQFHIKQRPGAMGSENPNWLWKRKFTHMSRPLSLVRWVHMLGTLGFIVHLQEGFSVFWLSAGQWISEGL